MTDERGPRRGRDQSEVALEAVAAEHSLEVELQRVPNGDARGWYAAIYSDSVAGLGVGPTLSEAATAALESAGLARRSTITDYQTGKGAL